MIERVVARAVARLEDALLEQAAMDLPDMVARRGGGGVMLEGRGLALRRVRDPLLRTLGRSAAK